MLLTLLAVLSDVGLGLMAYVLGLRLAKIQETQGKILTNLSSRVTALENGHAPRPIPRLGFTPEI